MRDRNIAVPPDVNTPAMIAKLKHQLSRYSETITKAGNTTYGARGTAADDLVALLVTGAMADAEGGIIHGSLYGRGGRRRDDTTHDMQVRGLLSR